jgi:hypothetical protein
VSTSSIDGVRSQGHRDCSPQWPPPLILVLIVDMALVSTRDASPRHQVSPPGLRGQNGEGRAANCSSDLQGRVSPWAGNPTAPISVRITSLDSLCSQIRFALVGRRVRILGRGNAIAGNGLRRGVWR